MQNDLTELRRSYMLNGNLYELIQSSILKVTLHRSSVCSGGKAEVDEHPKWTPREG